MFQLISQQEVNHQWSDPLSEIANSVFFSDKKNVSIGLRANMVE